MNDANEAVVQELIALTERLLYSVVTADWKTYAELCSSDITAFEPEGRGQLIEGLPFHKFYFDLGAPQGPRHTTIAAPRVRLLGDNVALVCYLRLTQKLNEQAQPVTAVMEETRIWEKRGGHWQHVHFHRSSPT